MDNKDIAQELKKLTKISNVGLPSGIRFTIEDKTLRMDISKAGISANMQENNSAFEGWAICLKAWLPEKIQKVFIRWDTAAPFEKNKQLHYNRFQYRVRKFIETYAWAESGSSLDFNLSGENPVVNIPTKPAKKSAEREEAKLEREFVAKHKETQTYDVINHQLPVGLFNTIKSDESEIMPRRSSQIDIWAIKNNILYIFELKYGKNKKVGIISELMFYVNIMNDIKNRVIQYPQNAADNKHRDFEKLYEAFGKGAIQTIDGQFLTEEIHPLISESVITLMNDSPVLRKEHITYSHIKIL